MALNSATLSSLLQTNLQGQITVSDAAQLKKICDAIAQAVVTHIQAAATVQPGTFTTAGGSVTGAGTVT